LHVDSPLVWLKCSHFFFLSHCAFPSWLSWTEQIQKCVLEW
jgi:hypothetical protein